MLKIKLSRKGKKKYPVYRLIISEVGRDPFGDNLEILGFYNPHTKELKVEAERIKEWIGKGAQLTPTVNNLLVDKKIIAGKKVAVSKLTKKAREVIAKKTADVSSTAKAMEDKKAAEVKIEEAAPEAIAEAPAEPAIEETKE
jgi:small subunit ribosomal protein S16